MLTLGKLGNETKTKIKTQKQYKKCTQLFVFFYGQNKPKAKQMPKSKYPNLLTLKDVSKILHVHRNTLRNWEREGLISCVRIGRRGDRRFTKESVSKLLHN